MIYTIKTVDEFKALGLNNENYTFLVDAEINGIIKTIYQNYHDIISLIILMNGRSELVMDIDTSHLNSMDEVVVIVRDV